MNFVYEDISKEDFEKFGIGALKAKYQSNNFDWWIINESRDAYLLLVKDTSNVDDSDFGTGFYVMNIQGLWVDFEIETLESGGEYGGETWVKYGIKKISPFKWDVSGKKLNISTSELPISYENIISIFCSALTVESSWWGRKGRTKHDVFFENLTQRTEV